MRNKILAVLLLGATHAAAAVTVGFDPLTQDVLLGNQALVNVVASGLEQGQVIGSYDVTVEWDDQILSFASVTLGSVMGGLTLDSIVPGIGQTNVAQVSFELPADLLPLQTTQPFTLFSIRFNTLDEGTSPLSFAVSPFVISDGDGVIFNDATGGRGSITVFGDGNPPEVPEPSTALLLAGGMSALLYVRRRRQSSRS